MVLADFSKAFDTVSFDTVSFKTMINKLHSLKFSKNFLLWLTIYLSGRRHYVQINDRKSNSIPAYLGIPQGSILGPMLFNLYVADLQGSLPSSFKCHQYADDTTMYSSCAVPLINSKVVEVNSSLEALSLWSRQSNHALNSKKTKTMLISTSQMSRVHSLHDKEIEIQINGKPLERVKSTKLLGLRLNEHLIWDEHVNEVSKSCYGILRIIRKLKNFTDFKLRKQLAEALVITKLDYCDVVYNPLPKYLVKRLQRVQYAAAGFVTSKWISDVKELIKLGWLPIEERREWHLLISWPNHLKLIRVNHRAVARGYWGGGVVNPPNFLKINIFGKSGWPFGKLRQ
jgi:hypothetical protein